MTRDSKYIILLALVYFIVSLVGILHHELWLDEAHHWLLSRDSVSFSNLIENTRYEGHPILWNILLFGITRCTLNPFWMQLLHICISTSAVIVFLRKAPFSWSFKTLFIFGYFMIFEYNLISRNYILGVLFLFLACSVFKERSAKFVLLCTFLALAANVHLMFGVIAFGLFLTLMLENFQNKEFLRKSYVIGTVIFISGLLLAFIQIIPPENTHFFARVHGIPFHEKFIKGFIALFKGLITIPDFTSIHFWNSNLLVNYSKPFASVLGLLVYIIPLLLFYKNKMTLFFTYITLAGMQVFFFSIQMGATRYDGMSYLIIIVALWIERYFNQAHKAATGFSMLAVIKNPIIYGILLIQLISGLFAYGSDFRYSFTSSKQTADYLKAHKLDTADILSVTCDGTAISPYLRKKIWFLCEGSYQSYCHWDFGCAMNISHKHINELLCSYMDSHNYAVYVSNYPLIDNPQPAIWMKISDKVKIRFLRKFDHNIVRNTYYYVFEVSRL